MNHLKQRHYINLIDIINKILRSKNPHRNIFKLSLAIICNPSQHSSVEKIIVNNEILLRNIIFNILAQKNEVSNAAIESFAEILLSPDLQKETVERPILNIINTQPGQGSLNTPSILRGLKSLVGKKWSNKSKNKHVFTIVVSIILLSEQDYCQLYKEVLHNYYFWGAKLFFLRF